MTTDRFHPDGASREFSGGPYLSYADLEEHYQKSRVTIWRWVRAGLLPAPYQLGPNSVGFDSQEIRDHDATLQRSNYADQKKGEGQQEPADLATLRKGA